MKHDETAPRDTAFEQRLRAQPVKQLPPGWRGEILSAVRQAATSRPPAPAPRHNLFSALLAPLAALSRPQRFAGAGLAAAWLVIISLNLAARDDTPRPVAQTRVAPVTPETLQALRQQRRLYAELMGRPEPREAAQPKTAPPGPRSQRRDEIAIG